MPTIMMCGANDLDDLDEWFHDVAKQLGFTPQSSFGGQIPQRNGPGSNFIENSIKSVKDSHAAVIVVYEDYGEITWSVEFTELLESGKPFRILIKANVYDSFNYWRKQGGGQSGPKVFEIFERARLDQKTFIRFTLKNFEDRLAYAISSMVTEGLEAVPDLARKKADAESLSMQLGQTRAELTGVTGALRECGQENGRLKRAGAELRRHVAEMEEESEQAAAALQGDRNERDDLRARLVQNRRHTWTFVPLVVIATLSLGLLLGGWITNAPDASLSAPRGRAGSGPLVGQSSVPSAPTPAVTTAANDLDDAGAAVRVVDQYFSYIRDQSWNSLASLQSDRFRNKNPLQDVTAFWEANPLGLWGSPKVVAQNRDVLWVRVPFIMGPDKKTNRLSYRYVYWAVLRDSMLIDHTANGAVCERRDESRCPAVAPPA